MKYRTTRYFTESDKALMWDRWEKGDSLHAIARLFDRSHGAVAGVFFEDRGHTTAATTTLKTSTDTGRARRDLAWCCHWPVTALHRSITRASTFNGQS